jgi:hypothetical protein
MIFASLIIEREPMRWADLGPALASWFQDVGIFAEIAILVGALVLVIRALSGQPSTKWSPGFKVLVACAALAQLFYVAFLICWRIQGWRVGTGSWQDWLLTLGGASAFLAFVLPVLGKILRMRWRRIFALARLSFKEAIHRRVVWAFCLMGLLFLFAGWFIPYKAEDQVRNYVTVVYTGMAVLLWLTGSLLAAFSIPTDVRNQTIHTIVTKPVERYEIVLGRFLGYGSLLTIVLAVLTGLSLLYVVRGVTEDAKKESYKARVPVFGDDLTFYGTKDNKGESVGREWGYRMYLPGRNLRIPNAPLPYAIWTFHSLPASLADRSEPVRCEFTFDIFRTTKGQLNRGVFCTLTFASGNLTTPEIERNISKVRDERAALLNKANFAANADDKARIEDELIAKYGVYEDRGVEAFDYHTQAISVPVSLFKKAIEEGNVQRQSERKQRDEKARRLEENKAVLTPAEYERQTRELAQEKASGAPVLKVLVNINRESHEQLIGVARRDVYLLDAELPFWQNFVKGSLGLWFSMMLLLGIAVACSTYLSGIISWFAAMFLFLAGFFLDYIRQLAAGTGPGGGPLESLTKLANRLNINAPLPESRFVDVARGFDEIYRWWLRLFLKIIPDVNRFDLTTYVGNGFDIPWTGVLLMDNFVPLVAYLLPWAVLAYYLMDQREVANPT